MDAWGWPPVAGKTESWSCVNAVKHDTVTLQTNTRSETLPPGVTVTVLAMVKSRLKNLQPEARQPGSGVAAVGLTPGQSRIVIQQGPTALAPSRR